MISLLLAQVSPSPDWLPTIVQGGVAGAVLAWFMFRTEARLKAIESSNDRIARANLLLVISLHQANDTAKAEARGILKEIDEEKLRTGGK